MKISLIMCILKILANLCAIKQKKCCLQCSSIEKILIEHKENCLIINGKPRVKLKSGSISLRNYVKKLPIPFKIYAVFAF